MTTFQASCVTPESKAMTERPAMSSQMSSEPAVDNCETIIQMTSPWREGAGLDILLFLRSLIS